MPHAQVLSSVSDEYDLRTTHVIAPSNSRTLKTFGASLSSAWIITQPSWILKCEAAYHTLFPYIIYNDNI